MSQKSFSVEEVMTIQKRLEHELENIEGILGIGIGYDRDKHCPKLKVMVNNFTETTDLPHKIEDLEVQYEPVEDIQAL